MKYIKLITLRTLIIGAVLITVFHSCVKKVVDLEFLGSEQWQPNLAAPLIYSSLTINDIILKSGAQGSIIVGNDNFCTIIYKGTLFSFMAKDLFQIPSQNYSQTINLDNTQLASLIGSGSVTINYSQTVNFNSGTGGPQIDSLFYKSGILSDSIVSDFAQNASITITIPSAKKGSQVFSQTLNINYTGTTPVISTDQVNLSGYKFDMTAGGTATNKFDVNYKLTITYNSANPATTSNSIKIYQKYSNPAFDKLYGYIGQQSLIPANQDMDTVALSVFQNSISGSSFTLADPRIKFIFSNSFGVPIGASMSKLLGFSAPASNYLITGPGIPNPLPIPSPSITQVGQTMVDSFSIDKTNSSIVTVVNSSPQNVIYQISSQSNPLGKVSENFILDTSSFKVEMEVQLPLFGTAKNFTIMDTIKDFKLNLSDTTLSIESMLLRTYIANGFPCDVGVQVYVTDTLYNKIDSLISPYQIIMPSALVNSTTGIVTSPSVKTTDSSFDKTRINNISKGKRALIRGTISTYNNGNTAVKIYSNYKLDVKIGVQAILNVKIN